MTSCLLELGMEGGGSERTHKRRTRAEPKTVLELEQRPEAAARAPEQEML